MKHPNPQSWDLGGCLAYGISPLQACFPGVELEGAPMATLARPTEAGTLPAAHYSPSNGTGSAWLRCMQPNEVLGASTRLPSATSTRSTAPTTRVRAAITFQTCP